MAKPTIYINGVPTEFNTEAEHDAYIASHSITNATLIQNLFEAQKNEMVGKDLIRDLYQMLKQQNLTQAQEGDIINRITPVLLALIAGFVRGASPICSGIATGGSFTVGRKNALQNAIDAAILLL